MSRLILCIFLFITVGIWSQQIPQYSQWSLHQLAINPAHAGIKKCIDVHTVYRSQWVGLEGAPQSGFLTASVPLHSRRKKFLSARHGLGVRFEADRIGQLGTNRINFAYAGHFNFSEDTRLSLGVYAGAVQFGFDHSRSTTITPDPSVMRETSILRPDAHFGAWWNGKNYYLGFMANQLIPSSWQVGNDSRFRFHFALNGGYRLVVNEKIGVVPSVMFRLPIIGPANADFNLMIDYKNLLNFGLGLRTKDAMIFMAGFKINQQFSLQYSFDFTVTGLNRISNNTHEIGISFLTCKPDRISTSKCPLFE